MTAEPTIRAYSLLIAVLLQNSRSRVPESCLELAAAPWLAPIEPTPVDALLPAKISVL